MTDRKTLSRARRPVAAAGGRRAGRPEDAVRVVAALPVGVTDDVDGAPGPGRRAVRDVRQLPSYRAMLDREGYAGPRTRRSSATRPTVTGRLAELASRCRRVRRRRLRRVPEGRARTRALLRAVDTETRRQTPTPEIALLERWALAGGAGPRSGLVQLHDVVVDVVDDRRGCWSAAAGSSSRRTTRPRPCPRRRHCPSPAGAGVELLDGHRGLLLQQPADDQVADAHQEAHRTEADLVELGGSSCAAIR